MNKGLKFSAVLFLLLTSIVIYSCKKDSSTKSKTKLTFTASGSYSIGDPFTFQSNAASGSTYLWKFGNGDQSTAANPTYTYNQKGTYIVTLQINGSSDTLDNYTKTIYISIGGTNMLNIANTWAWKAHREFRSSGILPDTSYDMNDTSFAISLVSDTSINTWGNTLKYYVPAGFTHNNRTIDFSMGNVSDSSSFFLNLSYHYVADSFYFTVNRATTGGFETLSYHTP